MAGTSAAVVGFFRVQAERRRRLWQRLDRPHARHDRAGRAGGADHRQLRRPAGHRPDVAAALDPAGHRAASRPCAARCGRCRSRSRDRTSTRRSAPPAAASMTMTRRSCSICLAHRATPCRCAGVRTRLCRRELRCASGGAPELVNRTPRASGAPRKDIREWERSPPENAHQCIRWTCWAPTRSSPRPRSCGRATRRSRRRASSASASTSRRRSRFWPTPRVTRSIAEPSWWSGTRPSGRRMRRSCPCPSTGWSRSSTSPRDRRR